MYSVSTTIAGLFKTNAVQQISVTVTPVTGSSFSLTSADILANGLTINRYTAIGNSIQLGTCIASELMMSIENYDGRFDSVVFEGAQLYVSVGTKNGNSTTWVPLGYFTVDNTPRRLAVIEISALDRMVQFDKPVNMASLNLPSTVKNLVSACCSACNVTLATTLDSFPNASYTVNSIYEMTDMTYRTVLQWCAELMGVCGYMNHQGQLALGWYTAAKYSNNSTPVSLTTADRYSSDIYDDAIEITGILVKGLENESLYGTDTYAFVIEGNGLFPDTDVNTLASNLSPRVGFTYHPFSASTLPMPYLWPLDMIQVQYKNTTYTCAITETTFTVSAPTEMKGTGESTQSRSYARLNPLTARERAIIESFADNDNEELNRAINNAIEFNDMITNALGLYITDMPDGSGGTIRYMHDAPNIADSGYVVTINAGGFAWTTDWNGGDPVWNYGITSSGFAMFRRLSAEGIDVTNTDSDYRAEVTPEHFNIYYRNELIITIDATDRAIKAPRIYIPYSNGADNYLRIGNLLLIPTDNGANAIVIGS